MGKWNTDHTWLKYITDIPREHFEIERMCIAYRWSRSVSARSGNLVLARLPRRKVGQALSDTWAADFAHSCCGTTDGEPSTVYRYTAKAGRRMGKVFPWTFPLHERQSDCALLIGQMYLKRSGCLKKREKKKFVFNWIPSGRSAGVLNTLSF